MFGHCGFRLIYRDASDLIWSVSDRFDFRRSFAMVDPTTILAHHSPRSDVASADLGDGRRLKRYLAIIDAMAHRPDASVPEAFEEEAELEGYYRFIRNPNIDDEALLAPHFEATGARSAKLDHVLCLHDTTDQNFDLRDGQMREHLARRSSKRQGFLWHASLVVSAEGLRAPLGLVHAQPFVHQSELVDAESEAFWEQRGGLFDNEKWRWFQGVERAEVHLEEVAEVTHVMDREFDDFQLQFCMATDGYNYVTRLRYDRNVCTGPQRGHYEKLREVLARKKWSGKRTIELSARTPDQASKVHPVRKARSAKVKIRAASVEIRRPDSVPAESAPDRIAVNVVEVREVNTPTGEEPVHWLLVTTRPIDTIEQMWAIVDWYRARWTIEEFFKAIKTGCGYKKLQHRSAKTLLCALSATAVVAHHLLVLRHLGRHAGHLPGEAVVTPMQLGVLHATKSKFLSTDPTAEEVMAAVASLGGHIRSNGPPGWQVLGRGWKRLLEYEHAFSLGIQAGAE